MVKPRIDPFSQNEVITVKIIETCLCYQEINQLHHLRIRNSDLIYVEFYKFILDFFLFLFMLKKFKNYERILI